MYSLDINFLKDRPGGPGQGNQGETKKKAAISAGDMTPIYTGVAVAVILPGLLGLGLLYVQGQNASIDEQITALEGKNQELESKLGNIKQKEQEIAAIKTETQALVSVFDQIRPWSAMLQSLRVRIPARVRIENVKQIPPESSRDGSTANLAGGIEITGTARSFNDVNDFLLSLQQSPLFKSSEGKIVTAELIDGPLPDNIPDGVSYKPPQIVKYTIVSQLTDVPASELMRELEQRGAVGLVNRIRSLQRTGVFQK
ncbi:fimbrial assembly family protein [Calothrix parasitica NIES-267]|uniref:Fimbrial assembly family protein n=1 Tax=Calothrix parasitica NIES-267 TaxID=1973488 RepID=A0A1Z4LWD9_9CYAN|nr:fimbrial assembly family protein [Calothrix parasitica NIES-267]